LTAEELDNYITLRKNHIDSLEYVWNKSDLKIKELVTKVNTTVDQEAQKFIQLAYDTLEGVFQTIVEDRDKELKTIEAIKKHEAFFYKTTISVLPDIFNDLFFAFTKNTSYDKGNEHISKLGKNFIDLNLDYRNPSLQPGPINSPPGGRDWHYDNKIRDELLLNFDGVPSIIQSVRNSASHIKDPKTKTILKKLKRDLHDSVSGAESPGSIFALVSVVILIIYEFIEVLQLWADTETLMSSKGSKGKGTP
jgi:hypothetical protein